MKNSIIKNKYINHSFYILGILFIFVIWHLGFLNFDNDYIIPGIDQTIDSLKDLLTQKYTYKVLGYTLSRLFVSVFVCLVGGVFLAGISKISSQFKAFIRPLFTLMKTMPIAVVIVLLLVMLEEKSLYYVVGVVVLPIIYEASVNGLDSIDKDVLDAVKLDSNITPCVVGKIHLPLTLPHIFTSLLQSVGLGLKVLVMAEFISNAKHSIGYEIMFYKDFVNEMSYVYAWCIVLILFVVIVDSLINLFKKKSLV